MDLEKWQVVWREELAKRLSVKQLLALRLAVLENDGRLVQGVVTHPPPLQVVAEWPIEGGCALVIGLWGMDGQVSVYEMAKRYYEMIKEADAALPVGLTIDDFLDFFDNTSREEMLKRMLGEIDVVLDQRLSGLGGGDAMPGLDTSDSGPLREGEAVIK